MPAPILATKLYLPPHRAQVVLRPRLTERLNAGLQHKLILISAPAGFGKTTLVSEWVTAAECSAAHKRPTAWLSLDAGDNDPARFLSYLVAALQTIAPHLGRGVLEMLQTSPPPPENALLTTLLNDIAAIDQPFILVLDDYHLIDCPAIDQALGFILEHLPPAMHLLITTREDPLLPLARLRARGQLTELRAADLRFTTTEAADFLNQVMGLHLPPQAIAALEARTEGWITGLQLAAISMQGRADTDGFIHAFTGSHRFVLDYLLEEVLQRQPAPIRSFLLQTSILQRLSAPLCDAVCAVPGAAPMDSKSMLEALERGNLFITALDDERHWYRYHHLFADVLHARLLDAHPEQVAGLHRRASVWFEHNASLPDAIRHALAAQDFERAAGLLELAHPAMDINFQAAAWLSWARALPDELLRDRPVLSVDYAWACLDLGEMEACESRLQDAERWLSTPTPAGQMVVADPVQFRSLPATIATARAYRALALGDVSAAAQYAHQALAVTPADDHLRYTQATSLLGATQYATGDLLFAEQSLLTFQAVLRSRGEIASVISIAFVLADIKIILGRLHMAEETYRQALLLATSQGQPPPVGTADLYRGLSELSCERGDLNAAADDLRTGQQLGEQAALTGWRQRLCRAQAALLAAQGDLDGALARLDEAARQDVRTPLPDIRPIAALKARLWLRQGRLAEAAAWAHAQGLSVDDAPSFRREFEHLTLAQVLIATYQSNPAAVSMPALMALLERLQQAAEAGKRQGSLIEILTLQALAQQAQGSSAAAPMLARALALAEPEGYLRCFIDQGDGMRLLLEKLSRHPDPATPAYVRKLLAALAPPPTSHQPANAALIEPLSERELEVLRLLRSDLSGPEIARRLVISLNTLRTHTKNIFNKLGVNNRRAAVRSAQERDLL